MVLTSAIPEAMQSATARINQLRSVEVVRLQVNGVHVARSKLNFSVPEVAMVEGLDCDQPISVETTTLFHESKRSGSLVYGEKSLRVRRWQGVSGAGLNV